jgi:hypothetical protein
VGHYLLFEIKYSYNTTIFDSSFFKLSSIVDDVDEVQIKVSICDKVSLSAEENAIVDIFLIPLFWPFNLFSYIIASVCRDAERKLQQATTTTESV